MRYLLGIALLLLSTMPAQAVHDKWAEKGLAFPPAVVEYLTHDLNHAEVGCGRIVHEHKWPKHLKMSGQASRVFVMRLESCESSEFLGLAWHEAILAQDSARGPIYIFGRMLKFVTKDGRELYNVLDNGVPV